MHHPSFRHSALASFIVAVCAVLFVAADRRPVTVFIIGDSTAAEKSGYKTSPEGGWGMVLQGYFDSGVRVENHAVNGRSSKSFRSEGRWDKVLARIMPGDVVIIQFGHNDEKPDTARHTDPATTFHDNLARFARETLARGGVPVLMSPVVRRNFFRATDGSAEDEALRRTVYKEEQINSDTLIDSHGAYRFVAARVAGELGVPFVDANSITHKLEQQLGPVGSRSLHMWYRKGEVAAFPQGRLDNTHYNIYGAHRVAALFADEIAKAVPSLSGHVVHPDVVVSQQGRGQYMDLQQAVDSVKAGNATTIYVLDGTWTQPAWDAKVKKIKIQTYNGATIGNKQINL